MLKIITQKDVERIDNPYIATYIQNLVDYLFTEYKDYCAESLEALGAIFILEDSSDWNLFSEMELPAYPSESCFEWIQDIGNGFCNGCIVLDNDRAIDVIGEKAYFEQFKEAFS